MYLDCCGPEKKALLKPVENLRKFINKTVEKIGQALGRVLNTHQSGKKLYEILFNQIETKFDYHIYLDFNYRRNEI